MSGKRIEAGDAYVGLGIRSKIKAGLDQAKRRLQSFGTFARNTGAGIAGAGLAIGSGFAAAAGVFAKTGDKLDKLSARTGVSVDQLSRLGFAAERSGSSLEDVEKALKSQARFMLDFSEGGATSVRTMEALGIAAADLEGKTPDDQMRVFADALSGIDDPGQRAGLALRVFGRAGSTLLPMLNGGAQGMQALGDEAQRLGLVLSKDQTDAAAALTDSWGDVTSVFKGMVTQIGAAVSGPLTGFLNLVATGGSYVVKFIQANQGLMIAVAGVAAGLVAAGGALAGLGTAALIIPPALGAIATAGGVVAAAFGALLSPIALVGAAVAGGIYYLAQYTEAGRSVVAYFSSGFATLKGITTDVIGGISSALAAGDLELAAKIGFTGVKIVIGEIMQEIERVFGSVFEGMFQTVASLAKSIGNVAVALDNMRRQASDTIATAIAGAGESIGVLPEGISETLREDQSRRPKVSDFEKLVNDFDSQTFGSGLSAAFDVDALRSELDGLRSDAEALGETVEKVEEAKKAISQPTIEAVEAPDVSAPLTKIQESFKSIASLSASSLNQRRPDARPLEEKALKAQEEQVNLLRQVRDGVNGIEGLAFE